MCLLTFTRNRDIVFRIFFLNVCQISITIFAFITVVMTNTFEESVVKVIDSRIIGWDLISQLMVRIRVKSEKRVVCQSDVWSVSPIVSSFRAAVKQTYNTFDDCFFKSEVTFRDISGDQNKIEISVCSPVCCSALTQWLDELRWVVSQRTHRNRIDWIAQT